MYPEIAIVDSAQPYAFVLLPRLSGTKNAREWNKAQNK